MATAKSTTPRSANFSTTPKPTAGAAADELSKTANGSADDSGEGSQTEGESEGAQELAESESEQDANSKNRLTNAHARRSSQANAEDTSDGGADTRAHYQTLLREHYADGREQSGATLEQPAIQGEGLLQTAVLEDGHYTHNLSGEQSAGLTASEDTRAIGDAARETAGSAVDVEGSAIAREGLEQALTSSAADGTPGVEGAAVDSAGSAAPSSLSASESQEAQSVTETVGAREAPVSADVEQFALGATAETASNSQTAQEDPQKAVIEDLQQVGDRFGPNATEADIGRELDAKSTTGEAKAQDAVWESAVRDLNADTHSGPDDQLREKGEPLSVAENVAAVVEEGRESRVAELSETASEKAPSGEQQESQVKPEIEPAHGEAGKEASAHESLDAASASEHTGAPEAHTHHVEHDPSMSELSNALNEHLVTHGMSPDAAHSAVHSLDSHLESVLSNPMTNHGSSVVFHQGGESQVTIHAHDVNQGHDEIKAAAASHGAIAVSMDALADIHQRGLPTHGLETIREHLPQETHGMSKLDVLEAYGHDVASAVQQEGFPHGHVGAMKSALQEQASHAGFDASLVTDGHALQALGANAREHAPAIEFKDEQTGRFAPIDNQKVVEQMTRDGHYTESTPSAENTRPQQHQEHAAEMAPPQI